MFPPAGSRLHANHRLGECGASPLPQPRLPCTPSAKLSVCTLRVRLPHIHFPSAPSVYTFRVHFPSAPYVYAFHMRFPSTPSVHAFHVRFTFTSSVLAFPIHFASTPCVHGSLDHSPRPSSRPDSHLGGRLSRPHRQPSASEMCSQIAPRDEPRAIAVIPPPFQLAFCQSGSPRTNAPKHPRTLTRHISDGVGVCSPLFCAIAPVVTLLHLNPRRHPCAPLGTSSRLPPFPSSHSFAVSVVTAVDCSRHHAHALLESSRSCATAVVTFCALGPAVSLASPPSVSRKL